MPPLRDGMHVDRSKLKRLMRPPPPATRWTIRRLSAASGVSASFLHELKKGERRKLGGIPICSPEVAEAIAVHAFGVPVEELFHPVAECEEEQQEGTAVVS